MHEEQQSSQTIIIYQETATVSFKRAENLQNSSKIKTRFNNSSSFQKDSKLLLSA